MRLKSKAQFEKRFKARLTNHIFLIGDLVLVRNTRIEKEHDRKTKDRYMGPYCITHRGEGGAYQIAELDGTPIQSKIAPFRLLPYITRSNQAVIGNQIEDNNETDEMTTEEIETDEELEFYENTTF